MRSRPRLWGALLLLAGGLVACGPKTSPSPPSPSEAPPAEAQGPPTLAAQSADSPGITIVNASAGTICHLYIAPATSDLWGTDFLGGVAIVPGGSQTFGVFPDVYDIKVEDCDHRILHASKDLSVQGPVTWTVIFSGGPPVPITLVNNSGTAVCYVRFSPSTAGDWGEDWLGAEEALASGSRRVFDVPGGTYDLQAQDCNQSAIAEQIGVALDSAYTWEVRRK